MCIRDRAEVIDADVQSADVCIHSAWRKANDHVLWRRIIVTATPDYGHAIEDEGCLRLILHCVAREFGYLQK